MGLNLKYAMNINGLVLKETVKGKTGCVCFIIKSDVECERIIYDSEDICFEQIGTNAKIYERHL